MHEGKDATRQALPTIVAGLRAKGYARADRAVRGHVPAWVTYYATAAACSARTEVSEIPVASPAADAVPLGQQVVLEASDEHRLHR